MPFVKLDCGMLDSSIWPDREARELFITALLMAEPYEIAEPTPEIGVDSLDPTDDSLEPGWYGFIRAAGIGIVARCGLGKEEGMAALRRLCDCDPDSRSPEHCGKRLMRISGGYIVLNYDKYRARDYTAAIRSKRYREKRLSEKQRHDQKVASHRDITQAEGEVDAEGEAYQNPGIIHVGKPTTGNRNSASRRPELVSKVLKIYNDYPRPKAIEHKDRAVTATSRAVHGLLAAGRFNNESDALDFLHTRVLGWRDANSDLEDQFIPLLSKWMDDGQYDNEG